MLGLYLFVEDQCKEIYHNTCTYVGETACSKKASDSLQKQNTYSTKTSKYTIILNYMRKRLLSLRTFRKQTRDISRLYHEHFLPYPFYFIWYYHSTLDVRKLHYWGVVKYAIKVYSCSWKSTVQWPTSQATRGQLAALCYYINATSFASFRRV